MLQGKKKRRCVGALRKLASGNYQATYQDNFGNRFTAPKTFKSFEHADLFLAQKKVDIDRALHIDPRKGKITLEQWWAQYKESKQTKWRETTQDTYDHTAKFILAKYPEICLGKMPVRDITPYAVLRWWSCVQKATQEQARNRKAALNPSAEISNSADYLRAGAIRASQCYGLLRQIFIAAVKVEIIYKNPVDIEGARKVDRPERIPATDKQVIELALLMPERYRAAVRVAAYSGLRQGELFALQRKDYDLSTKTISVNKSKYEINGKIKIGSPKTENSSRAVVLPPKIAAELEQHLNLYTEQNPTALIFADDKGKILARPTLWILWDKARKQLNLDYLHWHDLRHTGQFAAAKAGANARELMQRAGHKDHRASMIYTHADPEADKISKAMDKNIIELDLYRSA
jgi:integrase